MNLKKAKKLPMENNIAEPYLILVAEDDDISYALLKIILSKSNFNLLRTKNGKDTVEEIKRNDKIDLVLMDIKLPDLNGEEATRQIRQFNSAIPVIAQTAYALPGDKERFLNAGCNDYITKPVSAKKLVSKIFKYVVV